MENRVALEYRFLLWPTPSRLPPLRPNEARGAEPRSPLLWAHCPSLIFRARRTAFERMGALARQWDVWMVAPEEDQSCSS